MSTEKPMHTSGPWHASRTLRTVGNHPGCDIGSADGANIALVHYQRHDHTEAQAWANAHLIMAAPDLLAACKASWALGHKVYHNANAHEATPDWAEVRRLLEIAIAKAEGR